MVLRVRGRCGSAENKKPDSGGVGLGDWLIDFAAFEAASRYARSPSSPGRLVPTHAFACRHDHDGDSGANVHGEIHCGW